MDEIALHIDFLLHTHDCIIVPGLGGFVLNATDIERNGLWGLDTPTFELIFNSKLTYNDGLLAESLMRTNDISYADAIKQIEASSDDLRSRLTKEEEVKWTNLGVFKIDKENDLTFLPNKAYVRPQFFGLTNARLKPAALTLSQTTDSANAIPLKTIMRYVSTAIAVAVLFFFVVVSYNNSGSQSQHAEIVSKSLIFSNNKPKTTTSKTTQPMIAANNNSNAATPQASLSAATTEAKNITTSSQSSTVNYYIIVGVYEVRDVAEKTLSTLKSQGFHMASMIERPRRLDVYSASFSNREDAQTFLHKFQAENPRHKDAWILKR